MKNSIVLISLSFILLSLFLIAGCGQDETRNPSVTEIRDEISKSVNISEMIPGDEETLTFLYEVTMDDIEEFMLYTAPSNIQADELAIIKVKDRSKLEKIKSHMAQRVENQAASFKDYLPEEYALIERHVLKSRGNYILLAISDEADQIEEIFDESFK